MEDELSKRLANVISRKQASDAERAAKAEAEAVVAAEKAQRKLDAKRDWDQANPLVASACNAINASIRDQGLEFRATYEDNVAPAVARFDLILIRNGKPTGNDPRVNVNVSAFGKVVVRHTYTTTNYSKEFQIADATEDDFVELMVRLLEREYPQT